RRIIGMAFQLSTQFKKQVTANRITGEPIQTVHQADPNRRATPQSPGTWHIFTDHTREAKGPDTSLLEENLCCRVQHFGHALRPNHSLNRNQVVPAERHPQAIKTWSKVGDARWNANGNC